MPQDKDRKLATSTFQHWCSTNGWSWRVVYFQDKEKNKNEHRTNVWNKFIRQANLLQIKAAACGRLTKSSMPSGCGCMFDCDMLWLQGNTYIYFFSLWHLWCLLTQHNIPFKYRRGTTLKKAKGKSTASKHSTEPFQEFKLHPLIITAATSWENFTFIENIPMEIIYNDSIHSINLINWLIKKILGK